MPELATIPKEDLVQIRQRWEHTSHPDLILEIVKADSLSSYQWVCSMFIGMRYVMVCTVNTMTLLKYYKRLDV